jgi:flagellar basal body-associated protein FliL
MRGLKRFLDEPSARRLWVSLGIVASMIILVGVFGSWWFSFEGASDQELRTSKPPEWFFEALREDRITLAQRSAIQVLFWLALSGGVLALAVRNLLKATAGSFAHSDS